MPLLYVPPTREVQPPREWPKVPTPPPKELVWYGPDGSTIELTSGPYTSVTGRSGFGVVEPDPVVERTMSGAAWMRDVRATPRVMSVPLVIQGSSREEYLAAYRGLQRALRHHRPGGGIAPGVLRVVLPDGSWREIPAYYQGGLDMTEDVVDDLLWYRGEFPNLELYAPDPAFLGREEAHTWRIVVTARPFYPIYPVTLSPGELGGSATVTNPGDVDAYPIWELTGPGTPTVTNTDTGQSWGFTGELAPGQVVTVDTRPPDVAPDTGLTAVDGDGTDWWPNFDGLPDLWTLPPGTTTLEVTMTGATEDSLIRLRFRPRYLAGW